MSSAGCAFVGPAEVRERRVPTRRRRGTGRLREIAEHRHRVPVRAPCEHPQLHRREVLRLVDDDVPEAARRALHERLRLVDERQVVGGPRVGPTSACAAASTRCSSSDSTPSAARARNARCVSSDRTSATGLTLRQHAVDRLARLARRRAARRRSRARRARSRPRPCSGRTRAASSDWRNRSRCVANGASRRRASSTSARTSSAASVSCAGAEPHREPVGRDADRVGRAARDHLGEARVALDRRDRRAGPRRRRGTAARADRRRWSASPTSRPATAAPARCSAGTPGSGPTTSTPSRASRTRCSYSRNAARCSPTAVLPVPGPPCTTRHVSIGARMIASCSAWIVATMSRIWPVRARPSSASSGSGTPPEPASESGSAEVLFEHVGELAGGEHEPAPALEPERIGERRPVERRRDPGAPVDHHGRAVAVFDVAPPDVPTLARLLVDAAEAQHRDVVVERREPALQLPAHRLGVGLVRGEDVVVGDLRRRPARAWPRGTIGRIPGARVRTRRPGAALRPTIRERSGAARFSPRRRFPGRSCTASCTIRTLRLRERGRAGRGGNARRAGPARRPRRPVGQDPRRDRRRAARPPRRGQAPAHRPRDRRAGRRLGAVGLRPLRRPRRPVLRRRPTPLRAHRADARRPCRATGPLAERARALVLQRVRLYAQTGAVGRATQLHAESSPTLARLLRDARALARADLERVFAPSCDALDARARARHASRCSTCSPGPTRGRRCASGTTSPSTPRSDVRRRLDRPRTLRGRLDDEARHRRRVVAQVAPGIAVLSARV